MKLGVRAKLGEPRSRGGAAPKQRTLRAVEAPRADIDAMQEAGSEAFVDRAADAFSLETTPVEAPSARSLHLVLGGQARWRGDANSEAVDEAEPLERDASEAPPEPASDAADATERENESDAVADVSATPAVEGATGALGLDEPALAAVPVAEIAPTPAPSVEPAPVVGALSGSPSQIAQGFNALPPSARADQYTALAPALDGALDAAATEAASAVPELSVSLPGNAEPVAAPAATASTTPDTAEAYAAMPLLDTSEPAPVVLEAPEPAAVEAPPLPASYPVAAQSDESEPLPDPNAIGEVLLEVDATPEIDTDVEPPAIPLEGAADPAQLDQIQAGATDTAGLALIDARAGIEAVPTEALDPPALEQTVTVASAPVVEPLSGLAPVAGMDEFAGYGLGLADRAAFDAQVGPEMQASLGGATSELETSETSFDVQRADLVSKAEADRAAAQSSAEADRQLEVDKAHEQLGAEQDRVASEQELAVDGTLAELAEEHEHQAGEIDARLASDQATIDTSYAKAHETAEAEVETGSAQTDVEKADARDDSESQSWWDWSIDAWQSFVKTVSDQVVSIWEGVIQLVKQAFDEAIALATRVLNAAVTFAKQAISAYYDVWKALIQDLLGSVFPGLAAKLIGWIDDLQALVFAAIDQLAAGCLAVLRTIADAVVAGLSAGLAAYKAGVAGYLALWEAIQQGDWAAVGTAVLTALLVAAGIAPEEFFAMFGKLDEIIAAVAENPRLLVVNAIEALSLGFKQFGQNFLGHFMAAAVEWITGALSITLPDTFDLAGMFDVVRQILGLTYEDLRAKAVKHLGEGAVAAVEQLYDAVMAFIEGGWAGLWQYVKDGLTSVIDDAVMALGSWLVEKAILVAGRWIVGLAATMGFSAIVEGLIALWQFTMWIKDQFHRFYDIVRTTIDSVHDFVMGKIEPAANLIEATLENLIPPAIDLVAKLLNIGNIPSKVQEIIEAIRKAVDDAIEKVIVTVKESLGFGEKGEKKAAGDTEGEESSDPVYGSLLRQRAITLRDEQHHLYVTGQPGKFDLVIASNEEPAETNEVVKGDARALEEAGSANEALREVNVASSEPTLTTALDAEIDKTIFFANQSVDRLAVTLGGAPENNLTDTPHRFEVNEEVHLLWLNLSDGRAQTMMASSDEKRVPEDLSGETTPSDEPIDVSSIGAAAATLEETAEDVAKRIELGDDILEDLKRKVGLAIKEAASPELPEMKFEPQMNGERAGSIFAAPVSEQTEKGTPTRANRDIRAYDLLCLWVADPQKDSGGSTMGLKGMLVAAHLLSEAFGGLAAQDNLGNSSGKGNSGMTAGPERAGKDAQIAHQPFSYSVRVAYHAENQPATSLSETVTRTRAMLEGAATVSPDDRESLRVTALEWHKYYSVREFLVVLTPWTSSLEGSPMPKQGYEVRADLTPFQDQASDYALANREVLKDHILSTVETFVATAGKSGLFTKEDIKAKMREMKIRFDDGDFNAAIAELNGKVLTLDSKGVYHTATREMEDAADTASIATALDKLWHPENRFTVSASKKEVTQAVNAMLGGQRTIDETRIGLLVEANLKAKLTKSRNQGYTSLNAATEHRERLRNMYETDPMLTWTKVKAAGLSGTALLALQGAVRNGMVSGVTQLPD